MVPPEQTGIAAHTGDTLEHLILVVRGDYPLHFTGHLLHKTATSRQGEVVDLVHRNKYSQAR